MNCLVKRIAADSTGAAHSARLLIGEASAVVYSVRDVHGTDRKTLVLGADKIARELEVSRISNIVYIATSLDGYISDKDDGLDWLQSIPNPDNLDFGWADFMGRIDAIVMGRKTFETVCGFDCDWPYSKPVFVLSNSLSSLPQKHEEKVELISGSLSNVLATLHRKGHEQLYIDGGATIRSFLEEDLIDEMIITVIPILLGGGSPLFGKLRQPMGFDLVNTEVLLNAMVKNHYRRKR